MSTTQAVRTCKGCNHPIERSIYWDYHKVCAKAHNVQNPTPTPKVHTNVRYDVIDSMVRNASKTIPKETSVLSLIEPTTPPQPVKQATAQVQTAPTQTDNNQFIPTTNGYYSRKIGDKKDTDILKTAYDHKQNTLIVGETGTGKTHAVRHFCYEHKKPYMRVNLNEATTTEDLVGQWIPNKEGGFAWQDGVLTRFMRYGGVFVCDEINSANAGILFILHSVLDDERKLVLVQKDGEVVHAHPDFWFVSTMNPDYEGTKPLNHALKDRFQVILNYDYDSKVEKKLVDNPKLLELANNLRTMYAKGELLTPVSTRTLLSYCANEKLHGADLAKEILLNKFSTDERSAIREVVELTFSGKSNNPLLQKNKITSKTGSVAGLP